MKAFYKKYDFYDLDSYNGFPHFLQDISRILKLNDDWKIKTNNNNEDDDNNYNSKSCKK